ncbi:MAG TPA: hypothetical protein VJH68_04810 [Candidatus Nanoarchaeia archaeon]|nr:hypothetical protein [Candidatus Nanoarchaeia archaeon]
MTLIKYQLKVLTCSLGLMAACASFPEEEEEGFTNLSARNRYHSLPKPPVYREDCSEFIPVGKVVGDKRNHPDPLVRNILKLIKPVTIFEEGDSKKPIWTDLNELGYVCNEQGYNCRTSTGGIESRLLR